MEANLRARLTTAIIAIVTVGGVMGWGSVWHFTLLLIGITGIALREYFVMAFPGRPRDQAIGILWGGGISVGVFLDRAISLELWLGVSAILGFVSIMFSGGDLSARFQRLVFAWLGVVYLGFMLPHWVSLFSLPGGRYWAIFVLIVVCAGDSAAYFVGRALGEHRLAPSISPGKSIEGALGNLVLSMFIAGAAGALVLPHVSVIVVLLLGLLLSLLGQCGDLFESWIKRVFAVKDSGAWLPGHGGLLDRIDSLIFPAVFMTAFLRIFNPS